MALTGSTKRKRGGLNEKEKKYIHDRESLVPKLEPGDHIATKRLSGRYEHHGIYEGTFKGYPSVIHLQGPMRSIAKGSPFLPCSYYRCGYEHPENGGRVFSCIDCFSQGKKMFKLQYRTENDLLSHLDPSLNRLKTRKVIGGYRQHSKKYLEHYEGKQLFGHLRVPLERNEDQVRLYQLSSNKSREQVLEVARSPDILLEYDFFCNNCEHFAVFCKTGKYQCVQLRNKHIPNLCENGRIAIRTSARVANVNTDPEEQVSPEPIQSEESEESEEK